MEFRCGEGFLGFSDQWILRLERVLRFTDWWKLGFSDWYRLCMGRHFLGGRDGSWFGLVMVHRIKSIQSNCLKI